MAVNPDDGGVDHGVFHIRIIRDGVENPFENIGLHPISEPLEHRVPLAERGRKIPPRTARSGNPQHRLKEKTPVSTRSAGVRHLAQTVRFHFRPLGVRQAQAIHDKLRFGA